MQAMRRDEYAGPERLREMQRLASRLHPTVGRYHAGDLAWAAACAGESADCPTAVWRDGERVVAWGWLEAPGELSVQVDPDYAALAHEVLDWAEAGSGLGSTSDSGSGSGSAGPISTTISENEPHLAAALVERGYAAADDGPFFVSLRIDLTGFQRTGPQPGGPQPTPELPAGYTVRQCDDGNLATRAEAHRAAWSYWNSTYSERQHAALRALWPYKPEFDLMAIAPDGTPAAYYQGWYDEESRVGLFEPVGTHPEHRRRGLSRAVGTALLHRFAAAGGRMAVVNPRGDDAYPVARLTYTSMGFTPFGRTHTYKQIEASR